MLIKITHLFFFLSWSADIKVPWHIDEIRGPEVEAQAYMFSERIPQAILLKTKVELPATDPLKPGLPQMVSKTEASEER